MTEQGDNLGERDAPSDLAVWRETWRAAQSPPGPDCLDDETLSDLVAGLIEGARREADGAHIVDCRRCAPLTRDLMRVHALAGPSRPPTRRSLGLIGLLVAAAAILAVAVVIPQRFAGNTSTESTSSSRGGAEAPAAILPLEGAKLHEPPARFEWSTGAGETGSLYRVIVYDAQMSLLWESDWLTTTACDVPLAARGSLQAPAPYFWRVITSTGGDRKQSSLRRFDLVP